MQENTGIYLMAVNLVESSAVTREGYADAVSVQIFPDGEAPAGYVMSPDDARAVANSLLLAAQDCDE